MAGVRDRAAPEPRPSARHNCDLSDGSQLPRVLVPLADRPWRRNQLALGKLRPDWLDGQPSSSASGELLQTLRQASSEEASAKAVEMLNRGVAPQSIWDAIFDAAGELLMRRPGTRGSWG